MKKCPFCAEEIQDEAIKCRHCGSMLADPSTKPQAVPNAVGAAEHRTRRFRNITESDARLLTEGSTIELEADGTVSARAEEVLAQKGVTVVRLSLSPQRTGPQVASRGNPSAGTEPERTIYETGLHWAVFFRPVLWLIAAFLMKSIPALPAFFVLVAIVDFGGRFLMRSNTHFKLTTRRLSMSTGVLRKRSLELMLSKVESISVNEPMVGRMFGYGTVVVGGTGRTKEAFPFVPGPQEFRNRVQEQLAVQTG